MIALLLQRGVDVAFRLHQLRKYDFARGRRLGHDDHVVDWHRPARPSWMDADTYATMPETISVREVRFQVDEPGYRTRAIIVATIPARRDSTSVSIVARTSPTCTIGVGWRNSTCARSSGRWAWSA